ncbi:protein phosphatase 2C domain-containing protein [Streptomyces sp. NBC_00291]|uniref:protein phosphatase 2C domain-containing protein n=1 Tax=Streptomyces sp. NBC_00291 TaxID=2975704 RepID=UPI0022513BC7|nr:protein phosphatase 2C domain-containing protein [Streptomyces sp. NBC_00291]MCX5153344.1 protein phosphatase 2C domain-containing protein [Streptomyces sp. NBC_00291]
MREETPDPAHGPTGATYTRWPAPAASVEPEPLELPREVSAESEPAAERLPAPRPAPASPEPAPSAVPEPALAADAGRVPAVLGDPPFSGPKPPLYAPGPGAPVGARADVDGAVLPDTVVDGATHGPLTVRAASVRGDSHRYHAEPRQDALVVARLGEPDEDTGVLLLGVADGIGSAPRSHLGSQLVCREILRFLDEYAGELARALRARDEKTLTAVVNSAVGSVAESLVRAATTAGHRPGDYATTLRVLLVPLDPAVRHRALFTVGDGGAALLRDGTWYLDVVGAADGEGSGIIDTRTAALPTTRVAETHLFGPALPGDVFVLCTDGLSTPLGGEEEMRGFLRGAWGGPPPGLPDFLWQLQYRVKSYDDDRSAVCLWEGDS